MHTLAASSLAAATAPLTAAAAAAVSTAAVSTATTVAAAVATAGPFAAAATAPFATAAAPSSLCGEPSISLFTTGDPTAGDASTIVVADASPVVDAARPPASVPSHAAGSGGRGTLLLDYSSSSVVEIMPLPEGV